MEPWARRGAARTSESKGHGTRHVRGFIQLSLMGYAAVAAGALILVLSGAVGVQTARLDSVKSEYATFRADTKRLGDEQERRTKERIANDRLEKERRDADYKRNVARLERELGRLRSRASSSVLPAAPAEARDPARATFDRAELDRALREFTGGAAELVGEGAKAVEGLDSLK